MGKVHVEFVVTMHTRAVPPLDWTVMLVGSGGHMVSTIIVFESYNCASSSSYGLVCLLWSGRCASTNSACSQLWQVGAFVGAAALLLPLVSV